MADGSHDGRANILPLERDGLIRIEPAANDLRTRNVHLTKACEAPPDRKESWRGAGT